MKIKVLKVRILNKLYRMSEAELRGCLDIAREQVKFGIYAVKKNNYVELRNDEYTSKTSLRNSINSFKAQGFKVYYNG